MNFEAEEVFRLADGAVAIPMQDESVVLAMKTGKYFGVRGAARHLLEGLREGLTLAKMVEEIGDRYDVGTDTARRDLVSVLPKLIAAGIVERDPKA